MIKKDFNFNREIRNSSKLGDIYLQAKYQLSIMGALKWLIIIVVIVALVYFFYPSGISYAINAVQTLAHSVFPQY